MTQPTASKERMDFLSALKLTRAVLIGANKHTTPAEPGERGEYWKRLTAQERAVLCALVAETLTYGRTECQTPMEKLADQAGLDKSDAAKAQRSLARKGLIEVEGNAGGAGLVPVRRLNVEALTAWQTKENSRELPHPSASTNSGELPHGLEPENSRELPQKTVGNLGQKQWGTSPPNERGYERVSRENSRNGCGRSSKTAGAARLLPDALDRNGERLKGKARDPVEAMLDVLGAALRRRVLAERSDRDRVARNLIGWAKKHPLREPKAEAREVLFLVLAWALDGAKRKDPTAHVRKAFQSQRDPEPGKRWKHPDTKAARELWAEVEDELAAEKANGKPVATKATEARELLAGFTAGGAHRKALDVAAVAGGGA